MGNIIDKQSVSFVGSIDILTDAASREKIWRDGDIMYYPLGITDPDYCVLKFTAQRGRYYHNFKSEDFNC